MDSNSPVILRIILLGALWAAAALAPSMAGASTVELETGFGLKRTDDGFYCYRPEICDRQFVHAAYRSAATETSLAYSAGAAFLRERQAVGVVSESWSANYEHLYSPRVSLRAGFASDHLRAEMGVVAGLGAVRNLGSYGNAGFHGGFALPLGNGLFAPSMESTLSGRYWSFTVGLNPTVVTEKDGMVAALLGLGGDRISVSLGPVLTDLVDETLGAKAGLRLRLAERFRMGVGVTAVLTGEGAGSWIGATQFVWNLR